MIIAGLVFIKIRERVDSNWKIFFTASCFALIFGYFGYQDIEKYKTYLCLDKFGLEFNNMRRSRGVPVIPVDWYEVTRSDHVVEWRQKDSIAGHHRKDISVDSSCTLIFEEDGYYLRKINRKSRNLNISTIYANGKGGDSTIFRYYDGDSIRVVTKRKADSIFAAEKIEKDY